MHHPKIADARRSTAGTADEIRRERPHPMEGYRSGRRVEAIGWCSGTTADVRVEEPAVGRPVSCQTGDRHA